MKPLAWVALLAVLLALLRPAAAQEPPEPDTTGTAAPDVVLEEVEVTAMPFGVEAAQAPLALSVRARSEAEAATAPAVTLDALARGVPGLWIADRENYALGERVLVRGLGWRAAFGVRGTHVLLDGVPLTLPDGQAMLNVLDAAAVRRVEVVRGPASVFWGSGSGGVLALSTQPDAAAAPRLRVRGLTGAYGLAKADVAGQAALGRHRLSAWGSALSEDGYRDYGAVRLLRGGLSSTFDLRAGRTLSVVALGAMMPEAESPGGLTAEDAAADPTQVRPASVDQGAGKTLTQGHLALQVAQPLAVLPDARLTATLYGGLRTLDNPIVPRYIQLDRQTAGLRLALEASPAGGWRAGLGAEGEFQHDDRLETSNEAGAPGATRLTDQTERVRAGAAFARLAVPLGLRALTLTAAVRLDALRYEADDRLGTALADGSGARTVTAVSPAAGLSYAWRLDGGPVPLAGLVYANAAGALDAPTTTELGNRPDGAAGFNPDLEPERTWGVELGTRGAVALGGGTVGFDLAAFWTRVDRLLLPFEVDDVTYYRNAGQTRHAGLEVALDAALDLGAARVEAAAAYTWTQARFLETDADDATTDAALDGLEVPGFPEHLASWTAAWQRTRGLPLRLALEGEAASAYFADDANALATDAYVVVHARAALVALPLGRGVAASPFVALRNAFDAQYAGSVVVNAFGGRFYEPAAGRHVLAGLTLDLD